ncbi:sulfate permease A protein, chromate resistance (ABC superfamily, atp_bind) [Candidatus Methylobacter favarea]|uniref:Sulfate permease A protein, chromate resistance (ABC superfamily, atp_bind) n=1 Tax=Candidatus Methylobacter favarea TaxID=2707345 RepID=A0A8S0Y5Y6_9GAMM|nr:sulfate ABC transporter ATP-binding protein [Candidatus Methylobacter favarea]CAA9890060.1 sulfate permease A protein, chromate resistance (ABC superfamily, atp_bind) [Candidatus Methylobacter favarea]
MSISVSHISKNFGAFTALDDINLDIPEGELVALLGPSGCGKTTLLRIIAGLEQADQGDVFLKGDKVTDKPVKNRHIGFVFQHYALFRHMTVLDNVAFGLRVKPRKERPSEAGIVKKVHALLELVQLDWLNDRFPDQLSGGQRQRIALARALAVEPSVLLLDEPFGALDASVRKDLRFWLRNLHHELNVTSVFVTHDQEEAMEVANRVVVLNNGRIEQQGSPSDIYDHPANAFVSQFIGQTNVFDLDEQGTDWLEAAGLLTPHQEGKIAHVRPHDIVIQKSTADNDAFVTLKNWQHLGSLIRIELIKNGSSDSNAAVYAEMPNDQFKRLQLSKGDKVELRIRHAHWFH